MRYNGTSAVGLDMDVVNGLLFREDVYYGILCTGSGDMMEQMFDTFGESTSNISEESFEDDNTLDIMVLTGLRVSRMPK